MIQNPSQLISVLSDAGLISEHYQESDLAVNIESPWYVKVLLALTGWIAAVFILGFMVLLYDFISKNTLVQFIVGFTLIGAAYTIFRSHKNEFSEHLALALSLAGQAIIIFTIFNTIANGSIVMMGLYIALLQIVLIIIIPNSSHQFISSCAAAVSLFLFLNNTGAIYYFPTLLLFSVVYIWLNEFRLVNQIKKLHSIGYGLLLALMLIQSETTSLLSSTLNFSRMSNFDHYLSSAAQIIMTGVLFYLVWQILRRYQQRMNEKFAVITFISCVLVSMFATQAPGLISGIVILLLGFSVNNRVLLGIGIIYSILSISDFYFSLNTTLIIKSLIFFITGITLLLSRLFLSKYIISTKAQTV